MPRPSLTRPTLLPGLPRLWRDEHTLQLGLAPQRAVLVDLPDPRAANLLDLLDGSRPERLVVAEGCRLGLAAEQVHALLDSLRAAGMVLGGQAFLPPDLPATVRHRLTAEATALALRDRSTAGGPARSLRRRGAARAVVSGRGRLGAPVAVALAQSGVGHVWPDLTGQVTPAELAGGPLAAADAHRPRRTAAAEAVVRCAPGTRTGPVRRGTADIVVQLDRAGPAGLLAAGFARRRQAHLALGVRDGIAVVGPLVLPGGRPCLNCLDLHRQDRDPGWSEVCAQLHATPDDVAEPCDGATVLAATAYAVAETLAYLDGRNPETVGAAVEISAPGRFRRRRWPPHPVCGCGPVGRYRGNPAPRGREHPSNAVGRRSGR